MQCSVFHYNYRCAPVRVSLSRRVTCTVGISTSGMTLSLKHWSSWQLSSSYFCIDINFETNLRDTLTFNSFGLYTNTSGIRIDFDFPRIRAPLSNLFYHSESITTTFITLLHSSDLNEKNMRASSEIIVGTALSPSYSSSMHMLANIWKTLMTLLTFFSHQPEKVPLLGISHYLLYL